MTIPDSEAKLRPLSWRILGKALAGIAFTAVVLWGLEMTWVRSMKKARGLEAPGATAPVTTENSH